METKVLITGATGVSGNFTIKNLLKQNVPVRAMVHQIDDRSDALAALGAEIVVGDLRDFDSVSAAMKGITQALFLYPVADGLLEATAFFAQAALEENVKLIVNISQRTAVRNAPSHSAQAHWLAERLLDRSGVPVTHLQPTLFMEWLAYFAQEIKDNNRYISPFGDARYGTINSEDIGNVAAAILAHPDGHEGQTYRIYGPAELTGYDVADQLSKALNRKIEFTPIVPETFGDILRSFGAPEYQVKHIVAIGDMFRSGEFTGMNDNIQKLTGNKPLTLTDFIQKNINLFQ